MRNLRRYSVKNTLKEKNWSRLFLLTERQVPTDIFYGSSYIYLLE